MRVVTASITAGSNDTYLPMSVRIFYQDTVFWISARVSPTLSWLSLVEYLILELNEQKSGWLPEQPFSFYALDMNRNNPLHPFEPVYGAAYHEILYIHESEFENAINRHRRAILVSDMLKNCRIERKNPEPPPPPETPVTEPEDVQPLPGYYLRHNIPDPEAP